MELNRLAQMHCSLQSHFGRAAARFDGQSAAAKIQSGEMSVTDIDLAALGKDVMAGFSEEEAQVFMNTIMSDPSAIANLASTIAPGYNIDPSQIMQAMAGSGGMSGDLPAQLMSMMMQQQMSGGN